VEFVTVGDAHEVVVPLGLKVQAPELNFEPGWERVLAAHGVPLGPVLGADHHRDYSWEVDLSVCLPYLAHQLSVWKVVLTLTSKSVEIGLSMAGAKQYYDKGFILVPAVGLTSSMDVLAALYCGAPWCS
jgi:hypothetical protein